jgi:iron complex outermembrane recepter protein
MKTTLIAFIFLVTHFCLSQEQAKRDSSSGEDRDSLKYEIDEIVVIGTRAKERIIDIPYSVFKVDKKELGLGKKVSAKDVLADVPGLFLQSRFGTHDLRISIRGFGTRSNSGARGVRILQDGIPESEPDGETVLDAVDFTSLGGVEVVKGNLSSLYANAPGGVINFVSDLYFPRDYFSSTNQLGKFGLRQNGFRMGLKGNDSRFLLSYNYRNLDGYRQHSSEYLHLANAVYEAYLSKATITVLGNYVASATRQPGALTEAEYTSNPFAANSLAVDNDYRTGTKKGRLAIKFKTPLDDVGTNELEVIGYGGIKELEKAAKDYTISTRYSLGALIHLTNRSEIIEHNNVLTFGMDYGYQGGPLTDFENVFGQRDILPKDEYYPRLSNVGFYFLDHFNLLPEKLDLFLSGRFDKDVFTSDILLPYGLTDTSRTFDKFTPKIGVNFKIMPTVALYSSYGLSYDFPALSELSNTLLSSNIRYSLNPDLNAQTSRNFEMGIKGNLLNHESEFMRKVFFEVTYFNYIVDDEIVPFTINAQQYFRNAAKTNRQGVEVGFKSEPFEGIELTTNYTFTNFKYDDYRATIPSSGVDTVVTYKGNIVPSVPKHILNFILSYELEISEDISGLLQWDCDYITSMYTNDSNTEQVPGYFYGNAMVGLNVACGNIGVVGYFGVNNIFDKRYVGYVNINDFNGQSRETGEPRNVYSGLRMTYNF